MNKSNAALTNPIDKLRIAVVSASWHRDIVERAHEGITAELSRQGLDVAATLTHISVAGAFEIPLHAQILAESCAFDAVIACALIVNGGIYRHEFVTSAVIDGLMRVQLDSGVPVLSAVLTPRDFHDHEEHRSFFAAHFVKKGEEVASACLAAVRSLRQLRTFMR
ncbi:6,7-dimethyl-8-ribityllumazine synthase [Azohydromonas australica]|uniref:6,7-dimethyl-8-ribityllumazine synthase n=1 Tax=Azohydromonas australica TaxID=364039 RepID=UPI000417AB1F|nr:6,7-dimethyl-8-ribityllumazine synthase [Azohydromonas australica]